MLCVLEVIISLSGENRMNPDERRIIKATIANPPANVAYMWSMSLLSNNLDEDQQSRAFVIEERTTYYQLLVKGSTDPLTNPLNPGAAYQIRIEAFGYE